MVTDPKKDMNACEDFFQTITEAHILSAVMICHLLMMSLQHLTLMKILAMSLNALKRSDLLIKNVKKISLIHHLVA